MKSYLWCHFNIALGIIFFYSLNVTAMLTDPSKTEGLLGSGARVRSFSNIASADQIDLSIDVADTAHKLGVKKRSCCRRYSSCALASVFVAGVFLGWGGLLGFEYCVGSKVYNGAMEMKGECYQALDLLGSIKIDLKECKTQVQSLNADSQMLHKDLQEVVQVCKACTSNRG